MTDTIDAFVYTGVRTPFGRHAGSLAPVRPDDLLAGSIRSLVERGPFSSGDIEDVVIGCTNQAGEDSRNIARRAALLAGLPFEVAGLTLNRLCASGLAAVVDAGRAVACGQGDLFIAGGVESMSRAPLVMGKSDRAYGRQVQLFDSTLGSRFPNPRQTAVCGDHAMAETAEEVAKDLGIGRGDSDAFAEASQGKYESAKAAGFFADEMHAVEVGDLAELSQGVCRPVGDVRVVTSRRRKQRYRKSDQPGNREEDRPRRSYVSAQSDGQQRSRVISSGGHNHMVLWGLPQPNIP